MKPPVPPQNLKAEQSVLGAMLITSRVIPEVRERIGADDFYLETERTIYRAILELDNPDLVTLTEHLRSNGKLESDGGADYIHTLTNLCPVASNATQYAEIVREYSIRRQVVTEAKERIRKAEAGEDLPELSQRRLEKQTVGVLVSEIQAERVTWLWHGYIPEGKLTVLDGDPGLGKSTLALDTAARLSRGHTMPDGSGGGEHAGTVILSAEDGPADTIRPRLEAAGADLARVLILNTCPDDRGGHPPILPDDLDVIEKSIERVDAKLVIIDPLMAFLSGDYNSHKDQDIRRVLARIADLAEKTGTAFLVIRHLNKMPGGKAIHRGGGSIGIIGAARSGLLVASDPDQGEEDQGRRVLASVKCNLTAKPDSLLFRLEAVETDGISTSRIVWKGKSSHDANALLAQAEGDEKTAEEEAREFLEKLLSKGAVEAPEVKQLARSNGIHERTLYRAKKSLDILSRREGFGRDMRSFWELPVSPNNDSIASNDSMADKAKLDESGETGKGEADKIAASGKPSLPQINLKNEPELSDLQEQRRLSI